MWIVGLLNHETNNLRLELVESRTAEVLKYIIEKNIGSGNIIITDGWNCYSFLDAENSSYIHHSYNHGGGLFDYGIDTTSWIESIWAEIKLKIKQMYTSIRPKNFIFFLKEAEYRRSLTNLNYNKKLKILQTLIQLYAMKY